MLEQPLFPGYFLDGLFFPAVSQDLKSDQLETSGFCNFGRFVKEFFGRCGGREGGGQQRTAFAIFQPPVMPLVMSPPCNGGGSDYSGWHVLG